MKVSELIEHLSKMDPDSEVWTSIDEEGNGFNKVYFSPDVRYVDKKYDLGFVDGLYTYEDLLEIAEEDGEAVEDVIARDYAKVVLI